MAWWKFGKDRGSEPGAVRVPGSAAEALYTKGHAPSGRKGIGHKGDRAAAWQHLADFTASRVGVEAYIEPETNVTKTTIVLIATTGEWTRRQLVSPKEGWDWARKNGVPVYDIQQTGYPQRMRDWNEQQTREQQRKEQREMAERLRKLRDGNR